MAGGYGTLVSYGVPPYARAGLYAELSRTQQLLSEYRADPLAAAPLRASIADTLCSAGLCSDVAPPAELLCPPGVSALAPAEKLDGERVIEIEGAIEGNAASEQAWLSHFAECECERVQPSPLDGAVQ